MDTHTHFFSLILNTECLLGNVILYIAEVYFHFLKKQTKVISSIKTKQNLQGKENPQTPSVKQEKLVEYLHFLHYLRPKAVFTRVLILVISNSCQNVHRKLYIMYITKNNSHFAFSNIKTDVQLGPCSVASL